MLVKRNRIYCSSAHLILSTLYYSTTRCIKFLNVRIHNLITECKLKCNFWRVHNMNVATSKLISKLLTWALDLRQLIYHYIQVIFIYLLMMIIIYSSCIFHYFQLQLKDQGSKEERINVDKNFAQFLFFTDVNYFSSITVYYILRYVCTRILERYFLRQYAWWLSDVN